MKIMLIDDDPAVHIYHQYMMEEAGIESSNIQIYHSADKAIETIKQIIVDNTLHLMPDIILVDINMPIMNGWEFVESFAKLNLKKVPNIYIVSNSGNPQDKKKASELSIITAFKSKFLTKEFFQELLVIQF